MLDILLVDDEPTIRLSLGDRLRREGYHVTLATTGRQALSLLGAARYDVVVTDIRLPEVDGLTIFRHLRAESPATDVVLMTAYGAVSEAVGALREGALDYLTKPFDEDELVVRVARVAERRGLQRALEAARDELAHCRTAGGIVSRSPAMAATLQRVDALSSGETPVLIVGESGTGKELLARRIHESSPRRKMPFVVINCSAFPDTLLEAELFGYEKGAFTGALRRREGRFSAADGGTLFLDEVGELPASAQAKLLRVVEDGLVEPLGTNQAVKVDVRLVSATHRNLRQMIEQGRFRQDLYFRLNALGVTVPPLRERPGDLSLLVEHFLRQSVPADRPIPSITPRAWAALASYAFPGNVRELRHAITQAVLLARDEPVDLAHLPADIAGGAPESDDPGLSVVPLTAALRSFEREYLQRVLASTSGRRAEAAALLGISRKTLWEKLRSHALCQGDEDP